MQPKEETASVLEYEAGEMGEVALERREHTPGNGDKLNEGMGQDRHFLVGESQKGSPILYLCESGPSRPAFPHSQAVGKVRHRLDYTSGAEGSAGWEEASIPGDFLQE
jgi:hypothetical protein